LDALAYNQRVSEPFAKPIDARTRYCAVLGHPVRHSGSPPMQNAGMAALGLNWRYLAFEVLPDELPAAIQGAKAMRFVGLNLTVPHKLLAVNLMDALDESARLWGAVNTVRFEGRDERGVWRPLQELAESPREVRSHGFNTDADALARALREDLGLEPKGARILVLGAGGAGRTAALKLASERAAELYLVNRSADKAEAVAREIRERHPDSKVTVGYPAKPVDLLLNTTSLGLKPDDSIPLDQNQFSVGRAGAVYDMVYRPAETALLKAARSCGCRAANGLGMLLHQGVKALELWSGRGAPVQIMRQALETSVYSTDEMSDA
jgi:shikimate dehydrogenase